MFRPSPWSVFYKLFSKPFDLKCPHHIWFSYMLQFLCVFFFLLSNEVYSVQWFLLLFSLIYSKYCTCSFMFLIHIHRKKDCLFLFFRQFGISLWALFKVPTPLVFHFIISFARFCKVKKKKNLLSHYWPFFLYCSISIRKF